MTLEECAALYGLGIAKGRDLTAAALSALDKGLASDDLACLAGLTDPPMREAAPFFEGALACLGIRVLKGREAALFLAVIYAEEIVSGKIAPLEGSLKI